MSRNGVAWVVPSLTSWTVPDRSTTYIRESSPGANATYTGELKVWPPSTAWTPMAAALDAVIAQLSRAISPAPSLIFIRDSGGSALKAVHDLASPLAFAAHLTMLLHLAPDVLGHLVDRVQHVGRGLLRPQRDSLQAQGGLRHHAIGNPRVLLLVELDLQQGQLGDLLANPLEALDHGLTNLVRHLHVPPPDLDPHSRLLPFGLATGCYDRDALPTRTRCLKGSCEGHRDNPTTASLTQRPGAGRERCARGPDIVH